MHYIGIDPGKGGGFAVLSERGAIVDVWGMPETERDILDKLRPFASKKVDGPVAFAVLERVNAGVFGQRKAGRMGVSSAFTFGKGYGRLLMALTAARIPFNEVAPITWQRFMGCVTGGDKNVSKRRAQQLFPQHANITHAIADALLLAESCRRLARQGALGFAATPARKDRPTDGKEGSKEQGSKGQSEIILAGGRRGGKTERLRRQADERSRGDGSRQGGK